MPSPVALITGGASGIGLGLTHDYLSQSYNVLIADLNPPSTTAFPSASGSGRVLFHKTDVTNHVALVEAFEKAKKAWGRVDVVCAIAGISQVFTDPEGKDPFLRSARLPEGGSLKSPNLAVINVNLVGVLNTVHVAIAYFREQDLDANGSRGKIVAAGSTASLYPFPNESLYGAAKHGVLGTVRSLATTLKAEGIQINAIAPSLVETGIGNPEAFAALRANNSLTPMETITRAVGILTRPGATLTGQVLECCLETISLRVPPVLANEDEKRCMGMIWPWEEIEEALDVGDGVEGVVIVKE